MHLPEPARHRLTKPLAVLATGIGGTGVVTITAVLGQAAHIAGLGFGAIDVTGIAQKGGPVSCHMRFAERSEDIHAIRIGTEGADVIIGGDLVVTASNKVLDTVAPDHTAMIVSRHAATSGDFTRAPDLETPTDKLIEAIEKRAGNRAPEIFDAHDIAVKLLGDTIYANILLVGYAYQRGLVPVSCDAIEAAIAVNGVDIDKNQQAFRLGRRYAHEPDAVERLAGTDCEAKPAGTLEDMIEVRFRDLIAYQDGNFAARYANRIQTVHQAEERVAPGSGALTRTAAQAYYKLLAIKDEYEVARLFTDGRFERQIRDAFHDVRSIHMHLAPPLLSRVDPKTGRPDKRCFGPWIMPLLRLLAKGKRLRGTALDPFARTAERREERRLITAYESDLFFIQKTLTPDNLAAAIELAAWPLGVRGYGILKQQAIAQARQQRERLLQALRSGASSQNRSAAE
jgi:indolepyruvate ferredoxin oxidoreductase